MTDDADAQWEEITRPMIERGEAWLPATKQRVDAAFSGYSQLKGLRGAFYLGVESRNCEGIIPNEYPLDDPKHKAFNAGFRFGCQLWGD